MDIKKQVCELQQAKDLNRLNIFGASLFYWDSEEESLWYDDTVDKRRLPGFLNAFTVSELGAMLGHEAIHVSPTMSGKDWQVSRIYDIVNEEKKFHGVFTGRYETQATAYAALLIFSLKNKHILATTVNERLQNS